jgi:hypothetical protein
MKSWAHVWPHCIKIRSVREFIEMMQVAWFDYRDLVTCGNAQVCQSSITFECRQSFIIPKGLFTPSVIWASWKCSWRNKLVKAGRWLSQVTSRASCRVWPEPSVPSSCYQVFCLAWETEAVVGIWEVGSQSFQTDQALSYTSKIVTRNYSLPRFD